MAKKLARGPDSYLNEQLVLEMCPPLLMSKGFETARVRRISGMKFIEAVGYDGREVVFWLKQGWTDTPTFSAIQFGMFTDVTNPAAVPDSVFIEYVATRTERAKARGATHVLMVHMVGGKIQNYVPLDIDSLPAAYARQIEGWPARARNTKTPTLYFEDSRAISDAACVEAVKAHEVPLELVAGTPPNHPAASTASKKITAEVERRLQQGKFRLLVGERCGWRCVVSGVQVREVLEAAHLPGRDWRHHNKASDGIMLRSDLHRLLDLGLACIRDGKFELSKEVRTGDYANYHERELQLA